MGEKAVTTDSCDADSMSYYVMIRETIHGIDNLIVTTIHHSIVIITAALGLGVTLSPVIQDPWGKAFLFITTIVAFVLTLGSQKRVELYTDLLIEHVKVAGELEDLLLSDDNVKITKKIEKEEKGKDKKVEHAGERGKMIFKRGIIAFYAIEAAIMAYLLYWVYSLFFPKGVIEWVA